MSPASALSNPCPIVLRGTLVRKLLGVPNVLPDRYRPMQVGSPNGGEVVDLDFEPFDEDALASALADFYIDRMNGWDDPGVDQAIDAFSDVSADLPFAFYVLTTLARVVPDDEHQSFLQIRVELIRPLLGLMKHHPSFEADLDVVCRALLAEPLSTTVNGDHHYLGAHESENSLLRILSLVIEYMNAPVAVNDPCVAVRAALALLTEDRDVLTRLANDMCTQVREAAAITARRLEMPISISSEPTEDPEEVEISEIALCPCSSWIETDPPWYEDVLPVRLQVPRVHSTIEKHIREWDVHHAATQPYPSPIHDSRTQGSVVEYLRMSIPDQYSLAFVEEGHTYVSVQLRLAVGKFSLLVTTGASSRELIVECTRDWESIVAMVQLLVQNNGYTFERVSSKRDCVLEIDLLSKVYRLHLRVASEWFVTDFDKLAGALNALRFVVEPIRVGAEATGDLDDADLLVSPYRWFFEDQDNFSKLIPHAWSFAKRDLLPPSIPPYASRAFHERLAFFEAGHHLVRYGLGWKDIAKGFTEWDRAGRPTSDPIMGAVVGWFREYLPAYIAWAFNCQDRLRLMPQPFHKDLRLFEKADPHISSIWSGGWDPLHLTLHETGEDRESADATAQKQFYSKAFLLMVPKYANFYEHLVSLMVSQEIDQVEVVMPGLGKLPEFLLDEVTERAHATDTKIHRWGN